MKAVHFTQRFSCQEHVELTFDEGCGVGFLRGGGDDGEWEEMLKYRLEKRYHVPPLPVSPSGRSPLSLPHRSFS